MPLPSRASLGDVDEEFSEQQRLRDQGRETDAVLVAEHRPDMQGGVTAIRERGGPLTAVPYYAWNNCETGKMRVWMRATNDPLPAGPIPAPTSAIVTDANALTCRTSKAKQ